jgi:type IV pilus assembly protein PilY1
LTYWTRPGSNNEYLPPPTDEEEEKEFTEGTDGRKVSRGGSGQVKPGYLGSSNDPGLINNTTSDTTLSGPRNVFTEPDDGVDGTSNDVVNLDADSAFSTAVELLTDLRDYPESSLTYAEYLYQTVMSDCSDCASSYAVETNTNYKDTAELRVNNLIRFARGWDVDLDTDMDADVDKRDWWQSDPLHNRPLAFNYGARPGYAADRPDIRVIVAGNDGVVQMIRDGRKSDGSEDGVEAWAFLPREFVPLQKRLLQGTLGLYDPGVPDDPPHEPLHPYAMDGAPIALVIDNDRDGTIETDDNDQVYLYMGQRRGGKRYYALDISDPDDPKFLWSIGKSDDSGEFAEMGQSWSLMRAGIMAIDENGVVKRRPVLVFGGGYNGDDGGDGGGDLGKDSRVANHDSDTEILGTDDDEGNALFIVNALTGGLIWKAVGPPSAVSDNVYDSVEKSRDEADLVDSVAAPPTIVDGNSDGLIDRVYFADTGGNVWRLDAAVPDRNAWDVNKLFAGGRHVSGMEDNDHDRRFFNAPDVVFASDETGDFDAVILGSGDRAHPLSDVVENWFYMIKDRNTDSGSPPTTALTHNDLADLTDNCLQDESCSSPPDLSNGWKIRLQQCEDGDVDVKCGEKSLASPLTIEGTIFLTTYLPVLGSTSSETIPATCGPKEGRGLFYALDLQTATGVLDFISNDTGGSADTAERFDRLASPGIPPEVVAISPEEVLRPDLEIQKTKGRRSSDTFWYEREFE